MFNLNVDNALPRFDGDVTRYWVSPAVFAAERVEDAVSASLRASARGGPPPTFGERLIYVNGMQNPKDAHRIAALALSAITQREIYGVFNMPGTYGNIYEGLTLNSLWDELIIYIESTNFGIVDWARGVIIPILRGIQRGSTFGSDVIQGTADWVYPFITSPSVVAASAAATAANQAATVAFNAANAAASAASALLTVFGLPPLPSPPPFPPVLDPRTAIRAVCEHLIMKVVYFNGGAFNLATGRLFDFLRSEFSAGQRRIRIICHSQGSIISSNAVDAWLWARSRTFAPSGPPVPTTMYVLAGATPFWPDGVELKFFTSTEDMVPWLSLGSSYSSAPLGVLNPTKRFSGTRHTVASSGMSNNWFASHNIDEYFTSAFANAIRADLGLAPLNQSALDAMELSLQNQFDALAISV